MSARSRRPMLVRGAPAWAVALGGAAALAGLSVAVARGLSYDAWGWLSWGQEIVGGHHFTTDGYPTWKPLTGLISILLAPLGDAAPSLWLVIARAGALMSLWLAYRLASRTAGPVAGALAAIAVLIVPEWFFQAGVGGSEPLLTALLLGAVARHGDRDHIGGFLLVLLAALLRPESWPLLAASAIPAWRSGGRGRAFVVIAVPTVALLWFGGEYLGSGDAFRGSQLAKTSHEAAALRRTWALPGARVLDIAWRAIPLPLLLCVPAAMVPALRRRDPIVLALGLGALVWVAEVAVMAQLGYAGVTRFLFPAAAGLAVVGASGLVLLLRSAWSGQRVRVAVAIVAIGLAVPSVPHLLDIGPALRQVEERADLDDAVDAIVAGVGSRFLLSAPRLAAQGETITPLAWHLEVPAKTLGRPGLPGLALADTNQRWPELRRALHRGRLRFTVRIVKRDWALSLILVERRKSGLFRMRSGPSHQGPR